MGFKFEPSDKNGSVNELYKGLIWGFFIAGVFWAVLFFLIAPLI